MDAHDRAPIPESTLYVALTADAQDPAPVRDTTIDIALSENAQNPAPVTNTVLAVALTTSAYDRALVTDTPTSIAHTSSAQNRAFTTEACARATVIVAYVCVTITDGDTDIGDRQAQASMARTPALVPPITYAHSCDPTTDAVLAPIFPTDVKNAPGPALAVDITSALLFVSSIRRFAFPHDAA